MYYFFNDITGQLVMHKQTFGHFIDYLRYLSTLLRNSGGTFNAYGYKVYHNNDYLFSIDIKGNIEVSNELRRRTY